MIVIGYFGKFLWFDRNSAEEFVLGLDESFKKVELPVSYLRRPFLKLFKGKPKTVVIFGMNETIKTPRFETVAKNEKVTAKGWLLRNILGAYVWLLWLFKRNLFIQSEPRKKQLTLRKISSHGRSVKLKSIVPKDFTVSHDAGHFICNYAIWVCGERIKKKKLKTDFYFVHLPEQLSEKDAEALKKWLVTLK